MKYLVWITLVLFWLFGLGDRTLSWVLNGFDWVSLTQLATWGCAFGFTYYLKPERGDAD